MLGGGQLVTVVRGRDWTVLGGGQLVTVVRGRDWTVLGGGQLVTVVRGRELDSVRWWSVGHSSEREGTGQC